MKTLNEIYNEVIASDELKAKFAAVKSADEAVELVKELGGEATADEITDFLKEKSTKTGELTESELEQISGGKGVDLGEALASVLSVGIVCAAEAVVSAAAENVGTGIKGNQMLCDNDVIKW